MAAGRSQAAELTAGAAARPSLATKEPAHMDGWQDLPTNELIGPCDRSRGGRAESKALIAG